MIQSRSHTQSPFFFGGHYAKKGVAEKNRINYSTGGMPQPGRGYVQSASKPYRFGFNGQEKDNEIANGLYTAKFWEYDSRIARRWNLDPKPTAGISDYSVMAGNPILNTDVDGDKPSDFVKGKDGKIRWDKNANSQATTKAGETYLGKTLTLKFNSSIDKESWDGPMGDKPAGDKLTSTITLTGRENEKGELTSMVGTKSIIIGKTPFGTARDYYPGNGGSNNMFDLSTNKNGINVSFEQHASVSRIEEFGMNIMGYKIVDVAQKLNINYNSRNGNLSIMSYTNIFPSATLSVNRSQTMKYSQPSFIGTHTAPIIGVSSPSSGSLPIRGLSYYPTEFIKR